MAQRAKVLRLPIRAPLVQFGERVIARAPVDGPTAQEVARLMLDPRRFFTGRRLKWYSSIAPIWFGVKAMVDAGMALDEVLHPQHRRQPIKEPTFIFANARSGTTLLHRLMSLDDERFVAPKLAESLLPAVTWHRTFQALGRVDRLLGGPFHRGVEYVNDHYLNGWEGIHELRLDKEEEDEGVWLWPMLTPTITLLFTDIDRLWRSLWLDRLEPEARARFMAYYESAIQRFLYAKGGDRSYLNKNVIFTHRVRSVYEKFPDSRFVYVVRHPYDALGSMLQMWYVAWAAHSPDLAKDSPPSRAMGQLAIDYYRYALDARAFIPPEQFHVVRFDELVVDPKRAIEGIYDHFGMPMTDRYRGRLDEATRNAAQFKSRGHQYTLEEFGLTRDEVYRQLRDLFDEFGYEP
ncbi:MAG: sulfotransferase family protein [Myxococcota bacterium]